MKNRRKSYKELRSENIESEGTWAISYGDMITLLLGFFVIYFSADLKKIPESPNNIQGELSKIIPENRELKIYKTGKSFLIYFEGKSFFDSGKVQLKSGSEKTISDIVNTIRPYLKNYRLKVRAFTDSIPVGDENRFKSNLELSALRAVATMELLVKKGIPRHKMEVAGHGPMGDRLFEFINTENSSEKQKNSLSRSIMILLKKEST